MEKFFKVKEHGSTVKIEFMAGLTTFMAMAYILMVNANMFKDLGNVSYGAIYIATAISAVIGTVLIGLLANLPLGDDTQVLPGHESFSTLGQERRTNPYMDGGWAY